MPPSQPGPAPYELSYERDLACPDVWQKSLSRSRYRRRHAALGRRQVSRKKGASVAVSAAVVAAPATPNIAAATSSGDSAPISTPLAPERQNPAILKVGSRGPAVAAVQDALGVEVDGVYGLKTKGAVIAFQIRHGLTVDGIIGPETWRALFEKRGLHMQPAVADSAPRVSAAQVERAVAIARNPVLRRAAEALADARGGTVPAAAGLDSAEGQGLSTADQRESGPGSSGSQGQRDGARERSGGPRAAEQVSRPPARPERLQKTPGAELREVSAPGGQRYTVCGTDRLTYPTTGTITSTFGDGRNHKGVDIANSTGTRILAAACGTVTKAGWYGGYGNYICLRHTGGLSTCYGHLSRLASPVGAPAGAGKVIGKMRSTGN